MGIFSKWFSSKKQQDGTISVTPQMPQFSAVDYCEQGQKMLNEGKLMQAMEFFQAAIEEDKHFEKAYLLLSEVYEKQGKKDKAKAALYGQLAVDPNNDAVLKRLEQLNQTAQNATSSPIASVGQTQMQSSTSASNSVANNTTAVNPLVNAKENYRVYDGKPEDGFHFFIMFDDGNRLYFILYDNQLAVIRPNIKSFIDGWEGYAKPKGDLVIPKEIEYNGQRLGVVAIKDKAFNGCDKLTSVVLPNTIKVIESGSFSHCSRLTSINLPDSINTIGYFAFKYCKSLSRIDLPLSLTKIEWTLFEDCDSLEFVTIPSNVKKIESDAFRSFIPKKELCLIMEGHPPICEGNLGRDKVLVKVPQGTLEAYLTAPYWQLLDIEEM